MYLVYRILECNYIGLTKDLKLRKIDHKHRLTNANNKHYNLKIYQNLREQNLNFNDLTFKILKENIKTKRDGEIHETMFMIFYNSLDNGTNDRWSYVPIDIQKENIRRIKNKSAMKKYNNNKYEMNEKNKVRSRQKIQCPICNLELSKGSLKRHNKTKHPEQNLI